MTEETKMYVSRQIYFKISFVFRANDDLGQDFYT